MREGRFAGLVAGMAVVAIGAHSRRLRRRRIRAPPRGRCPRPRSCPRTTRAPTWAGGLPTPSANDSDCAAVEAALSTETAVSGADGPGLPPGANFNYTSNMTPLGHTLRVPPSPTALADINSDMAFKGNLAFQGHWSGFRVIDVSDPTNPVQIYNTEACRHTSGQGDVIVHGNILVRTWDSPATGTQAGATCGGEAVNDPGGPTGFEGIHIWDISNPAAPVYKRKLRMASQGNADGRSDRLRRAHGDRSARRCAWQPLPLRRRLERHLPGHRHRAHHAGQPDRRGVPAARGPDGRIVPRQQRDHAARSTWLAIARAATASPCSRSTAEPSTPRPRRPRRRREPDALLAKPMPASPSAIPTFSYDGTVLISATSPAAARRRAARRAARPSTARCSSSTPAPATARARWCTRGLRPAGELHVAQLQRGADDKGARFACPAITSPASRCSTSPTRRASRRSLTRIRLRSTRRRRSTAGTGRRTGTTVIYESDIRRGVIIWTSTHDYDAARPHVANLSNPQTQMALFAPDNDEGRRSTSRRRSTAASSCRTRSRSPTSAALTSASGVESCVGTVADGAAVDTSTIGYHTFTVTATDNAGNVTTKSVETWSTAPPSHEHGGRTVPRRCR